MRPVIRWGAVATSTSTRNALSSLPNLTSKTKSASIRSSINSKTPPVLIGGLFSWLTGDNETPPPPPSSSEQSPPQLPQSTQRRSQLPPLQPTQQPPALPPPQPRPSSSPQPSLLPPQPSESPSQPQSSPTSSQQQSLQQPVKQPLSAPPPSATRQATANLSLINPYAYEDELTDALSSTYDISRIPASQLPNSISAARAPSFTNDLVVTNFSQFKNSLPPSQRRAFEIIKEYDEMADVATKIIEAGANGYRKFEIDPNYAFQAERERLDREHNPDAGLNLKKKHQGKKGTDSLSLGTDFFPSEDIEDDSDSYTDTFGYRPTDLVTDVEEFSDYYDAKTRQLRRESQLPLTPDQLEHAQTDDFSFHAFKDRYQKQRRRVKYAQYEKYNVFGKRIDNNGPSLVRSRRSAQGVLDEDRWDSLGRQKNSTDPRQQSEYNSILDASSQDLYDIMFDYQPDEELDRDFERKRARQKEFWDELEEMDILSIDWLDPQAEDVHLMLRLIESELQVSFDELKRHVPLVELEEFLREKIATYQWYVIEANQEDQRFVLMTHIKNAIKAGEFHDIWDNCTTETVPHDFTPPFIQWCPHDNDDDDDDDDDHDVEPANQIKSIWETEAELDINPLVQGLRQPIEDLKSHQFISHIDINTAIFLNYAMHILTSSYFGSPATQLESTKYSLDMCEYFENNRISELQSEENNFIRARSRAVKQLQRLQDEHNELVYAKRTFDAAIIQNVERRLQIKQDFRNYCLNNGILVYIDPELDAVDMDALVREKMKYVERIHAILLQLDGDLGDDYGLEGLEGYKPETDSGNPEHTDVGLDEKEVKKKSLRAEFDSLVKSLNEMDQIDSGAMGVTQHLLEEKGYVLPEQRETFGELPKLQPSLSISQTDLLTQTRLQNELHQGKELSQGTGKGEKGQTVLGENGLYISPNSLKIHTPGKKLDDLSLPELVEFKTVREAYEKGLSDCETNTKMFFHDLNAFEFQFNENALQQERLMGRIVMADDRFEDYCDSLHLDEKSLLQLDLANSLYPLDLTTYKDCKKMLIAADIIDAAPDVEKSERELQIDKDLIDFVFAPQSDSIFYYDEARNTLKRLGRGDFAVIKLRPDPRDSNQKAFKMMRRTAFLQQIEMDEKRRARNRERVMSSTKSATKASPQALLNGITDSDNLLRASVDDIFDGADIDEDMIERAKKAEEKRKQLMSVPELMRRWDSGDKSLTEDEYLLIKDFVLNPHRHDGAQSDYFTVDLDILDPQSTSNVQKDYGLTAYEALTDTFDEFRLKWLEEAPDEEELDQFFDLIREDGYTADEIEEFLQNERTQHDTDRHRRRKHGAKYDFKLARDGTNFFESDSSNSQGDDAQAPLKPLLLLPPESWYNAQGLPAYQDALVNTNTITNVESPNRSKTHLPTFQQYSRFVENQDTEAFRYDHTLDCIYGIPLGFYEALNTSVGKNCEFTQPYIPFYYGTDAFIDHRSINVNTEMIIPSLNPFQRDVFTQLESVPQFRLLSFVRDTLLSQQEALRRTRTRQRGGIDEEDDILNDQDKQLFTNNRQLQNFLHAASLQYLHKM